MTEKAFVIDGYWQALDKARCGNWDNNRSWKGHTQLEILGSVFMFYLQYI